MSMSESVSRAEFEAALERIDELEAIVDEQAQEIDELRAEKEQLQERVDGGGVDV